MSKTVKWAYMIVPLIFFTGCEPSLGKMVGLKPEPASLKPYKLTLTSASGTVHKEKVIYSTTLPHVVAINDSMVYIDWDGERWRQNVVPVAWLVEIEPIIENQP